MLVVNARRVERAASFPPSNRKKDPKRGFRGEDPIPDHYNRDSYNSEESLSSAAYPSPSILFLR